MIVAAVMIISYLSYQQGRKIERSKGQEELLDAIEKSKAIVDRVDTSTANKLWDTKYKR